jgi:BASS family bile acid:Na+ symporter
MVYVARADVALSVTIGALSTLLGIVATPLLAWLYVAKGVQLDVLGLLRSILVIVALPVCLGVAANRVIGGGWKRALPVLSMLCVVLIIGVVVASSRGSLARLGPSVLVGVVLHNGLGLLGGYWGGRALGFDGATCRTLAFEVGMQNSGLAATLARIYVSPAAALPGAVFSVWHNLSGSTLAAFWARRRSDRVSLSGE